MLISLKLTGLPSIKVFSYFLAKNISDIDRAKCQKSGPLGGRLYCIVMIYHHQGNVNILSYCVVKNLKVWIPRHCSTYVAQPGAGEEEEEEQAGFMAAAAAVLWFMAPGCNMGTGISQWLWVVDMLWAGTMELTHQCWYVLMNTSALGVDRC